MAILIDKERKIFGLNTKSMSYVFGIDPLGLVEHFYWGEHLENLEDFEMVSDEERHLDTVLEEYPVFGGLRYTEHCLKVQFEDGTRELDYRYEGYTLNDNELIIHLKDVYYSFSIHLHYVVHDEYDLLERYVSVVNEGEMEVEVEKIHSGQFHIPFENLYFSNFHGQWCCENLLYRERVEFSKIVIESRRGTANHNHNPFFILDKDASETSGEVYFGALKLTGNFSGSVNPTPYGDTQVQLGINSHDFSLSLKRGETFVTPVIICGYTKEGFEEMSHRLHRFSRETMLRDDLRMVLYNSWEATTFNVQCDEQIKLAKRAAQLGAELFVVDDGWFGQRHSDQDGLGDWYVNQEKFPQGLTPLIDTVKEAGMKFGIWVEPEMVNPRTDLFEQHPDWIYHYKTRTSDTCRHQYVLNVCKPEVKQFIINMLDELLSTYDIAYLKWDANRPLSQAGLNKDIWYRHFESIYEIIRVIKQRHPHVLVEACASGGGRIDFGALTVFDDFWTSDNTDAYDRISIQEGYSYIYPIKAMRAWVTDESNFISSRPIPLRFRFHVAMMGTLGIGANILHFTEDEMKEAAQYVSQYKEIRHIIQDGTFYRLENTSNNDYHFYQYVKNNQVILFALLPQTKIMHRETRVRLRGLEKGTMYEVKLKEKIICKSGAYLMQRGLPIYLQGDYQSEIIELNAIK